MSQVESIHLDNILRGYPKEAKIKIEEKVEKFKTFSRREELGFVLLEYIVFNELEKLNLLK